MEQKLARPNQAVEKTLTIIEIMAEHKENMRLQDIAAKAGLPTSTALRLINTLQRRHPGRPSGGLHRCGGRPR